MYVYYFVFLIDFSCWIFRIVIFIISKFKLLVENVIYWNENYDKYILERIGIFNDLEIMFKIVSILYDVYI